MLVSVADKQVLYWDEDTYVFVYDSGNNCQNFCQIKELDIYRLRGEILRFGAGKLFLEPTDGEKNPCTPKQKYFPPDCVGPSECPYPGVCYRFETEQQDCECSEGDECFGGEET